EVYDSEDNTVSAVWPRTFGPYDVAALQSLYGVNPNNPTNGKTYSFGPDKPIFETLTGDNLTLNFSKLSGPETINLNPGSSSDLAIGDQAPEWVKGYLTNPYNGTKALTLANTASVSKVIGGSGPDTIIDGPGTISSKAAAGTIRFRSTCRAPTSPSTT